MIPRKGGDSVEMKAGEKIKVLMKRKGISMGDMADGTGQTRQNLSNKMKRDDFSESEIRKMAAVLGCTVNIQIVDADGNVEL